MPLYRFYLSASPGDASPAGSGLSLIDASSPAHAAEMLRREGRLPADWQSLWIHFLVWTDQEGQQRGFESIQLHSLITED
jgi:hypothetical protein